MDFFGGRDCQHQVRADQHYITKTILFRQVGGQDGHVGCQGICADTPHCVAYTFVKAEGRCDLKDSAGAWKLSGGSGLVSGKLEELQEGTSSN